MDKIKSKNSVFAGFLIALGGCAKLYSADPLVGSVLFSIGLISVILTACSLYTGKIGFLKSAQDAPGLLIMLAGNILGAWLLGVIMNPLLKEAAQKVAEAKLSAGWLETLIRAFACGVLIYLAVELFGRYKSLFVIVLPVTIFVYCGFEHCIANVFYLAAAGVTSLKALGFVALCIAGNSIGSLAARALNNLAPHLKFGKAE